MRALFRNEYLYSLFSKFLTVGLGLVYSVLFARYVGADIKGDLAFISSIVTTGSVIITIGIHHAYPFYRRNSSNKNEYTCKFVSTATLMYLSFLIIATVVFAIDYFLFNDSRVGIIALFMVLWSYNRVYGYVLMVETPNAKNKFTIYNSVIELIVLLLLYFFTSANLLLGLLCMAFAQIVELLYFSFALRHYYHFNYVCVAHLFQLMSYGILPMIALVMNTLNYRIDVIMLKGFAFVTTAQIGIYSVGIALAEKVLLIPDALQEILLSKLAKEK